MTTDDHGRSPGGDWGVAAGSEAEAPGAAGSQTEAPGAESVRNKKRPPSKDDGAEKPRKTRKRPAKEDSLPGFAAIVADAIRAKEAIPAQGIRKKRPRSPPTKDGSSPENSRKKRTRQGDGQDGDNDMSMNEKTSGSSESTGGVQAMSSVAHEVEKFYEFIMDDKGEARPAHIYSELKDCIILKEKNPKTVLKQIEKLLAKAGKSCKDYKGCSFQVPVVSGKQRYVEGYGWVLESNKFITYDLSEKMWEKTVGLVCVLTLIAETIKKGITVTNRHIFYCSMDVFKTQKVSDHFLACICCMLKCTKSSLMVVAEPKGVIAGPIQFVMKKDNAEAEGDNAAEADNAARAKGEAGADNAAKAKGEAGGENAEEAEGDNAAKAKGEAGADNAAKAKGEAGADNAAKAKRDIAYKDLKLNQHRIQRIPELSEVKKIRLKADFILVVEKKSILHNLLQTNFLERYECVLVSGSGYPDMVTRLLLKEISVHTQIPIYALVDPDPHGLSILLVYKFGSKLMSYDRMGLAVPRIKWIPINIKDLALSQLSEVYFSQITEKENSMLANILKDKDKLHLTSEFVDLIQCMRLKKVKVALESHFSMGIEYLSEVTIPNLLKKLKKRKPSEDQLKKPKPSQEKEEVLPDEELWWGVPGVEIHPGKLIRPRKFPGVPGQGRDDAGMRRKTTHDEATPAYPAEETDKEEALDYIMNSHGEEEVVQIDNMVLTINQLRRNVTDVYMHGDVTDVYMHGDVINAYIRISFEDTTSKSFLSTFDAEGLVLDYARKKWLERIVKKCTGKQLVFIPLHVHNNHYLVMVLNFTKGEAQILNSLPTSRDVDKENKLLSNLKEWTNLAEGWTNLAEGWTINPIDKIPRQADRHSCGAFVLKYMMHWDGEKITGDFGKEAIGSFKRKICLDLLLSDQNKLRKSSYKELMTKEAYDAEKKKKTLVTDGDPSAVELMTKEAYDAEMKKKTLVTDGDPSAAGTNSDSEPAAQLPSSGPM